MITTPNTTDTATPTGTNSQLTSESHPAQAWKIAAACVCSVLGGLLLLAALVWVRRRRRKTLPVVGPK